MHTSTATTTTVFTTAPSMLLHSKDTTKSGKAPFSLLLSVVTIALAIIANVVQTNPPPHQQIVAFDTDWDARFLPMAQKYMSCTISNSNAVLSGLTVLITGASTNDIGRSLTRSLTSKGATVIATGRSPTKLRQLQQETFSSSGTVIPIVMKIDDLQSVEMAAALIEETVPAIDIIINSAGMHYIKNYNPFYDDDYFLSTYNLAAPSVSPERGITAHALNYLSHVLLVEKLVPLVQKSKQKAATLLHISSAHHWGDEDDLKAALTSHAFYDTYQIPLASAVNTKLTQIGHALSHQLEVRGGRIRRASIALHCEEGAGVSTNTALLLEEAYRAIFDDEYDHDDDYYAPEFHWFAIHRSC